MTDAQLRHALLAIKAIPVRLRYARKARSINAVTARSGLNRLTIYRFMNGDETVTRESKDRIRQALLAIDGNVTNSHPRMPRHDAQHAAGVATGPSIAKSVQAQDMDGAMPQEDRG